MAEARGPRGATFEPLVLPPLGAGPHVFLSGPMAVGKSTVGPLVAAALGRPFVDLDREIEARGGASVAEIFRARGAAAFRALEATVVGEVAARAEPHVVALGGGSVSVASVRGTIAARGTIVTLVADPATLAARAGGERPLLLGAATEAEKAERLAEIIAARSDAYAESNLVLDVGVDPPEVVASAIVRALPHAPMLVALGARSYGVYVEDGVIARVGGLLFDAGARHRVLVVTDTNAAVHADHARASLASAGLEVAVLELPPGEEHKTVRSLEAIWDAALAHGVDRRGAIVGVGGGVVLDVAGFAAATLARGVRWVAVPTTLLAMVDAAVGGKTAIDRPGGKNLVGAIHQPALVAVDPSVLSSLPDRTLRAGLAEVVKCAWIAGEAELAALEASAERLVRRDPEALAAALEMGLRVKARIVAFDEHEAHARLALNLGHTIGHALEAASGYALPHGEAVSLGLVAAHRVARALGRGGPRDEARSVALLARLGLPVDLEAAGIADPALAAFVARDKKVGAGLLRFVLPEAPGILCIARLEPNRALEAARGAAPA